MRIELEGATELVNRLVKFDKDVYKILERELKSAALLVADDARGRLPPTALSNWGRWSVTTGSNGTRGAVTMATGSRDLSFSSAKARRGIKAQVPKKYNRGALVGFSVRVVQMDAAGAIYELAGSQDKSGHPFNRNMNNENGSSIWPRSLTPALYAKGDEAARGIEAALDRAVDALN
jgi:hypothetical protein